MVGNTGAVLDGDLDGFIEASLKAGASLATGGKRRRVMPAIDHPRLVDLPLAIEGRATLRPTRPGTAPVSSPQLTKTAPTWTNGWRGLRPSTRPSTKPNPTSATWRAGG